MAVFNHTAHKEMWDWLNKHPSNDKEDYVRLFDIAALHGGNNHCYACEAVASACDECPLHWGTDTCRCFQAGAPYFDWWCATNDHDDLLRAGEDLEDAEEIEAQIRAGAIRVRDTPLRTAWLEDPLNSIA